MKNPVIVYAEYIGTTDSLLIQYESGTVRKYPMDKLPKTIQAYMDEHPETITGEEEEPGEEVWSVDVRDPYGIWYDVYADDTMDNCIGWLKMMQYYNNIKIKFVITHYGKGGNVIEEYDQYDIQNLEVVEETGFTLVDAPMVTALVPVTMTTALVPVTKAEEPETTSEPVQDPGPAEKLAGVAATVARATGRAIIKAATVAATKAPVIIRGAADIATTVAPVVGRAAGKAACQTASGLVSLYYLLTTYLPILARWVAVHGVWAVQDALPYILAGIQATGKAVKQGGCAIVKAASMVAGWVLVLALATISTSIKARRMVKDGWKLREEIIREEKAA